MTRSHRAAPRRPYRSLAGSPRRWPRRLLVSANIAVAICLLGAASAYGYVQWRLDQIKRTQIASLTKINGGKPFTLLVVGSDSRAALSGADNQQFGGASTTPGQRSDTIILARIAPATRQIMLLSIPRDLFVNIPGHGLDRINSAFDVGPNLLVQTIQTDLGIPVNHFVEVNFDTFRDITNAVGGVSFYFPTPAKDAYSLLRVPQPGCVLLTGDQALGFVRSRHYQYYLNGSWHYEAASDLARIQRQQAFIKKMIKKAEGEFTNPIALNNVISGITKNLTVDSAFGNNLLLDLAKDFRSINASGIPSLTLPTVPFTTAGGAEVLQLAQPQAGQTIAAFNSFGNSPPPAAAPKATASTVAPASVTVEVANGTGVSGQAAALTSVLASAGFKATTDLRSPGYGHSTTEVLYSPHHEQAARQVLAAIPGGGQLVASSALTATPYQVEVLSGTTYTTAGSTTPSHTSPTASASTAPTTTVPGTNSSTYVLPGMPPGQTPPSC